MQFDHSYRFQEIYDALSIQKESLNIIFSSNLNSNNNDGFLALKEQANIGLASAQFELGLSYERGENTSQSYKLAYHYYKLAADQGHSDAQVHLAQLYVDGRGVKQDLAQAFYYYKLAADQESPFALSKLGLFYAEGLGGVERSITAAFYYYQLAADLESTIAMDYLADAYERGIYVEKSKKKASYYRKKRFQSIKEQADEGNARAQFLVGHFFEHGEGVKKSIASAIYYYQLSADQNFSQGLFVLGRCYKLGIGVEKSSEKVIDYYKLAADQHYPTAQLAFAHYLLEHKIDEELAVSYLKLVIQRRQCDSEILSLCEYYLGVCFENGLGIRKSEKNALHYYKLAAEHGDDFARDRLRGAYLKGELGLTPPFSNNSSLP